MNRLKSLLVVAATLMVSLGVSASPKSPAPSPFGWSQPESRDVVLSTSVKAEKTADFSMKLSDARLKEGSLAGSTLPVENRLNLSRIPKASSVDINSLTGDKTQVFELLSSYSVQSRSIKVSKGAAATALILECFVYSDVTVNATVDLNAGTVKIPVQKVVTMDGGDEVSVCKVDPLTGTFDSKAALTGHILDGSIILDDTFGFLVTKGPNQGRYLNVGFIGNMAVGTPNSKMDSKVITFTDNEMTAANRKIVDISRDVFVFPVGEDGLRVMNVYVSDTAAGSMLFTLNPDGTIDMAPQKATVMAYYGTFYFYKLTEKTGADGKISYQSSVLSPLVLSYDKAAGKITMPMYGVAKTSAGLLSRIESSVISPVAAITFPAALGFDLQGEGTEASPYLIKTAQDFLKIGVAMRNDASVRGQLKALPGSSTDEKYYPVFAGKYFKVDADIDFSSLKVDYKPIGDKEYQFAGILDGASHTIGNFRVVDYPYDWCGLIGCVAPEGSVKNLNFKNAYVSTLGYSTGVLCGGAWGAVENIDIENAVVLAPDGYHAGALAASVHGVKNINVTNVRVQALGYAGGVVARSYKDLTSCHASGSVSISAKQVFAGGVVAQQTKVSINDPAPKVTDCSFSGTVYASNNEVGVGGIAGAGGYSDFIRCASGANLVGASSSQTYFGGLIGSAYQVNIADCISSGFVRNPGGTTVGGIIGHNTKPASDDGKTGYSTMTNTISANMLESAGTSEIRGLAGDSQYLTITNSYYDNQIAPIDNDTYGRASSVLASAAAIPGFSADVWSFEAGRYPSFKEYSNANTLVASAAVVLAQGNTVNSVDKDFNYTENKDLKWTALKSSSYDASGGYAFAFDNGVGRLNLVQQTDTVFVESGSSAKYYILNIAPVFFQGEGTAESPWLIRNKDEFKSFVNISNSARMQYENRWLALTGDIDMEGEELAPVCQDSSAKLQFLGHFDGRGFAIRNLKIQTVGFFNADNVTGSAVPGQVNPRDDKSKAYGGIFGTLGKGSVVKNLVVDKSCDIRCFNYGGAIAGSVFGTIENCYNYAPVKVYFSHAGGIAGYVKEGGKITGCYNEGTVQTNANTVGGIAGMAEKGSVENCVNTGEVSALFINPYQKEGSQYKAGGIVGEANSAVISNVSNSGAVSSYKEVGGIAGRVTGKANAPVTISNALNFGFVDAWSDVTTLGAIAGANTLGTYVNCVTDSKLQHIGLVANSNAKGTSAMATSTIVGNAELMPAESWTATKALYPMVKLGTTPAQYLLDAGAYAIFTGNDYAGGVASDFTLTSGYEWSLKATDAAFTISGDKVTVKLPESGVAKNELIATKESFTRVIPVMAFNYRQFMGEGTAAAPFIIATVDDYLKLATIVNDYKFSYTGMVFTQTADLDFKDIAFKPIGMDGTQFDAEYNGNSHIFGNVAYDFSSSKDKTKVIGGLFGVAGMNAYIHNVVLDESCKISVYQNAGGVVGQLFGKVENCTNSASVSTYTSPGAGGIVGNAFAGASIIGSTNKGIVTSAGNQAGGILGVTLANASVLVKGSVNEGYVKGKTYIGGIVGAGSVQIESCSNTGLIEGTTSYAAGIIGNALATSSITSCVNKGEITVPQYGAGVLAYCDNHTADDALLIKSCRNEAEQTAGAKGYFGGIAASTRAYVEFVDCHNTGKLTASKTTSGGLRIGGIAASAGNRNNFTDCTNTGDIICYSNSGGIAGATSNESYFINCLNTGNIEGGYTSLTNLGGIVGNGKIYAERCINTGNITAAGSQAGGFNGTNTAQSNTLKDCINLGDVKAKASAGGFIGLGRGLFTNCVNYGDITADENAAGIVGQPGAAQASSYTTSATNCFSAGKVTVAKPANSGNIFGYNASARYIVIDNAFYNADNSVEFDYDKKIGVTAKTTREIVNADLGADFTKAVACYPMVTSLKANVDYAFNSALLLLAEGDTFDKVTKNFNIGCPQGVSWNVSEGLKIAGSDVEITTEEQGKEATVECTAGESLAKKYTLKLFKEKGGIGDIESDADVKARIYFDLSGYEVKQPVAGAVYLVKTIYNDGKVKVAKAVYKD